MTSTSATAIHRFGPFEVRPAQRRVLAHGRPVAIGTRALDLLLALIDRCDRVVDVEELLAIVWPGLVVEENNLRQQVAALRKLFGGDIVATVTGRGYRLGVALDTAVPAPARRADAADAAAAAAKRHNLPRQWPALIGRDDDLAAVVDLARQAPLLTLAGPGGVGKTRLSLAVAEALVPAFRDGVWLVELAPVTDPDLVAQAVARALGVHEEPRRALTDTLLDYLRGAQLLLVLDNCEHVVDAAARWVEGALQASAGLRVLATSREPLQIGGEQVWRVQPLPTPDPQEAPGVDRLLSHAAPRLFVQRAMAADPSFRLTEANAGALARICHQLDGLPLALELAAARVPAMRLEQIADRLDDRFALLSRGSRTAEARHQTLRALIDWSHELLTPAEATLLRRLSVFAGGCALEAAEVVCADDTLSGLDILDGLAALVQKSLLVLDERTDQTRYRLLETIRQYGLERLRAAGEEDALRSRHLLYLAAFAESMRAKLAGEDQLHWHALVDAERDDIRAALQWADRSAQPEAGLRLLSALHRHWYKTMPWGEVVQAQQRLAARFEALGLGPNEHLARSFYMAGMLATPLDPRAGRALCERAVSLSQALGFDEGLAWAQMWMAHLDQRRRDPATAALFDESQRCGERIPDPWVRAYFLGNALVCHANYEAAMGRDDSALAKLKECERQIARSGNDAIFLGHSRALQATMALRRGDLARADVLAAESLALHRAVDSRFDVGAVLAQQGLIALRRHDPQRALRLFQQSLPLHRHYPMSAWVTKGLAHLAIAFAACADWPVAARLAGALSRPAGLAPRELSSRVAQAFEEAVASARSALGEPAFAEATALGAAMTREQAIAFALDPGERPAAAAAAESGQPTSGPAGA